MTITCHYLSVRLLYVALDVDDKYVKVLLRRAQSYEATEKLESAFEGAVCKVWSFLFCIGLVVCVRYRSGGVC